MTITKQQGDEWGSEVIYLRSVIRELNQEIKNIHEYDEQMYKQIDEGCRGRCALDECVCMKDDIQQDLNEEREENEKLRGMLTRLINHMEAEDYEDPEDRKLYDEAKKAIL